MAPPSEGRVTLPQALAYASQHAPDVVVAASELGVGEAEIEAARQLQPFNPTLSVGLGQRQQGGGRGLDAHVALSQQLEVAGGRKARKQRADAYRELMRIGVDAAAWAVHAEVHWSFQRALLASQAVELADGRVAVAADLLRVAERKVEVGDESPLVLEIAKAELAVARNDRTAAEAELRASRVLLASSIGWSDPVGLEPVGTLPVPAEVETETLVARENVDSSPTLRRAGAARRVAEADLKAARREAWPTPTVGLSFTREGSTTTPGNFSPASTIWMGTIGIPIPAFARNQGPVARNKARVEVAEAREYAVSVEFEAMVRVACNRVDSAAKRTRSLESDVLPAYEASLAGLQRSYEVGEMRYAEVAQAVDRLWVARQTALGVRAEYYRAHAELERLVGPLENADLPEPTVEKGAMQ